MMRKDHFTCYITERDGIWQGLCTDLDIGVQGSSMEDTRAKLNVAVSSYVADVMAEAPENRGHLLNRRAPWSVRARLAARVTLDNLLGHGHDARFVVPCPV